MTPDMLRAVLFGLFADAFDPAGDRLREAKTRQALNLRKSFHEPQAVTVQKFKRPKHQRSKRK